MISSVILPLLTHTPPLTGALLSGNKHLTVRFSRECNRFTHRGCDILCQSHLKITSDPLALAVPESSAKSSNPDTVTSLPSRAPGSEPTSIPPTPTSPSASTPTDLISSTPYPARPSALDVQIIPLTAISKTQVMNGRLELDPDAVAALARTIAANGLLNPITVRPTPQGFELVAGLTRLAAATLLGWTSIPANIRALDNQSAHTIRLVENIQRSNLSPVEEAMQLGPLVDSHPDGADGVALDIGRKLPWILDRLELLQWPPSLLEHIHNKRISLAAAKRLTRIQPPQLREERITQAAHYRIDARTAALWLQDSIATAPLESQLSENAKNPDLREYDTRTSVLCFVCRQRKDSQSTIPTHVCTDCYAELQHKQNPTNL